MLEEPCRCDELLENRLNTTRDVKSSYFSIFIPSDIRTNFSVAFIIVSQF